jgi:hypothetical protein
MQELIAHSTIKAFNQGLAHERERIIKLLQQIESDMKETPAHEWEAAGLSFAIAYLRNEFK